ncbi:OsmC family protein [Exiguobacterium artemiae]|uniref:OsmC family protein n=1 Tax=Exiguobacterium artemiae TaxID=340145 RepID=UPI002964E16E|nr:OsmC family protein [Exiguobacterium sibiricum]MDW2884674.1 OsmC family protein [Exiguobacterium sibiricum]
MHFVIQEQTVEGQFSNDMLSVSSDPEKGFRPLELFVTSLAGCSGTLLRNLLHKKRIAYTKLMMDVTITRDPERANRISSLRFQVTVEGEITPKQCATLSPLVLNNCGMIQSVIDSIDITFMIEPSDEQ